MDTFGLAKPPVSAGSSVGLLTQEAILMTGGRRKCVCAVAKVPCNKPLWQESVLFCYATLAYALFLLNQSQFLSLCAIGRSRARIFALL